MSDHQNAAKIWFWFDFGQVWGQLYPDLAQESPDVALRQVTGLLKPCQLMEIRVLACHGRPSCSTPTCGPAHMAVSILCLHTGVSLTPGSMGVANLLERCEERPWLGKVDHYHHHRGL